MPVNDVALVRRRQEQLAAIRAATAAQLGRAWDSLDDYSHEASWLKKAQPVLTAGQSRAIDLQVAHLQALLGDKLTFDRGELLAASKIDPFDALIAFRNALSNGSNLEDAVEAGRRRAEGVGESGVQWASRAANTAAEGDERIVGWTRTLGGGSCDWCITVSQQVYKTVDSASFGHLRCSCGVDPIVGTRDPGRALNRQDFG